MANSLLDSSPALSEKPSPQSAEKKIQQSVIHSVDLIWARDVRAVRRVDTGGGIPTICTLLPSFEDISIPVTCVNLIVISSMQPLRRMQSPTLRKAV